MAAPATDAAAPAPDAAMPPPPPSAATNGTATATAPTESAAAKKRRRRKKKTGGAKALTPEQLAAAAKLGHTATVVAQHQHVFPFVIAADKQRGRFPVAARDIAAGELVMREEAYGWAITDEAIGNTCHYCTNLITSTHTSASRCDDCQITVWCSKTCRDLDAPHHKLACAVNAAIPAIAEACETSDELLRLLASVLITRYERDGAYRMRTDASGKSLGADASLASDTSLAATAAAVADAGASAGADESKGAEAEVAADGGASESKGGDATAAAGAAASGAGDMAGGASGSGTGGAASSSSDPADEALAAGVVDMGAVAPGGEHVQASAVNEARRELVPSSADVWDMVTNRHMFADSGGSNQERTAAMLLELLPPPARVPVDDVADLACRVSMNVHKLARADGAPGPSDYAFGMFPLGSLFNHSCDPNIIFSADAQFLELRALRDVKAGEELAFSYIQLYRTRQNRQQELLATKLFTCACARCTLTPETDREKEMFALDSTVDGFRCTTKRCSGYLLRQARNVPAGGDGAGAGDTATVAAAAPGGGKKGKKGKKAGGAKAAGAAAAGTAAVAATTAAAAVVVEAGDGGAAAAAAAGGDGAAAADDGTDRGEVVGADGMSLPLHCSECDETVDPGELRAKEAELAREADAAAIAYSHPKTTAAQGRRLFEELLRKYSALVHPHHAALFDCYVPLINLAHKDGDMAARITYSKKAVEAADAVMPSNFSSKLPLLRVLVKSLESYMEARASLPKTILKRYRAEIKAAREQIVRILTVCNGESHPATLEAKAALVSSA